MSKGFDEVFTAVSGADDLLDHYQFTHDPFAPRTPGFRFFTPKRKSVLAELHHLARYGDQVMAVTGPQGSGKTLLRQALVASSNKDSIQCVVLSAREMPAESALLAGLCQAVSAEQRDVASLLRKAQQSEAVGIQLYLVIDDAECLESSAVSMLSEIAEAGPAAPRVFLFADSEAEAALSLVRKSDDAPAVHMIALQPLDVAETRDYMAQRLEGAGQGIELLDDAQVEWVHQRSGGWPGGINQAARQALLAAMQEAPVAMRRAGGNPFPVKALAALVLIAAGIGVAWYMGDQPQEPERTVLQLPAPVVEAQSQAPVSAPLPGDGTTSGAQNASSAAASEEDAVPTLVDAQAPSAPDPAPVQTEAPALDAEPDPAPALTAPAPAPAPAPEPAAKKAETEPREVAPPAAPAAARPASGYHDASWYRQRPGSEYVVQLLGSRSEAAAKAFIARHAEVSDLGYFETTHQGEPWYVVTQGAYASRQAAQAGVAKLPPALRDSKPWPRGMADIQSALR